MYCDACFSEYHSRGHRKLHTYKRIRLGEKPYDEKKEHEEFDKYSIGKKKENLNPNTIGNGGDALNETFGRETDRPVDTPKFEVK